MLEHTIIKLITKINPFRHFYNNLLFKDRFPVALILNFVRTTE